MNVTSKQSAVLHANGAMIAQTVAIIMPNRNHGYHLSAALKALAAQTRPPDEIIIVDDASTDDSWAILEDQLTRFPRLRIIRHDRQAGPAGAINTGLAAAQSEFVVCTAADDRLKPAFLEQSLAALARHPEAGLCVSEYVELDDRGLRRVAYGSDPELGFWYLKGADDEFIAAPRLHEHLQSRFLWLPVNAAVLRRAALLDVGGFDPGLRWHSDFFAIYAIALKYGFCVVPQPLSLFRRSADSYSAARMNRDREQREVARWLQDKLSDPRFRYMREVAKSSPALLHPFVRPMLRTLPMRPRHWDIAAPFLVWFAREVLAGRRPGKWRDFLRRFRKTRYPA